MKTSVKDARGGVAENKTRGDRHAKWTLTKTNPTTSPKTQKGLRIGVKLRLVRGGPIRDSQGLTSTPYDRNDTRHTPGQRITTTSDRYNNERPPFRQDASAARRKARCERSQQEAAIRV